jgi:hypothetical protein
MEHSSLPNSYVDISTCSCILDSFYGSKRPLSSEHIAYLIGSFGNCIGILEWDIDTGNTSCICPDTYPYFMGGTWAHTNERIIAIKEAVDTLYVIKPEGCQLITIESPGSGELVDLSYDSYSDTLYGISTKTLYKINMGTGKITTIGSMDNPGLMISLDCDKDGNMYGLEVGFPGHFYSINTSTGHATQIGPTGVYIYGNAHMAYDKDYDTIYAIVFNYLTWILEFHTINVTTGDMTLIYIIPPDYQFSVFTITYSHMNNPPTTPTIVGPASGKVGKELTFTFHAYDPDGDDIRYFIKWGDNNTEWTKYFPSCTNVTIKHTWDKMGDYVISAKAEDIHGAESPWGSLEITMPKTKQLAFNYNMVSWLFKRLPNAFSILRYIVRMM